MENPQTALVCEGLSAPGSAVAAELLGRGWRVAVVDGDDGLADRARRLAEQTGAGDRLAACGAELADEGDRESAVEFVLEQFGRIDLLVGPSLAPAAPVDLLELEVAAASAALVEGPLATLALAQRVAGEMIRMIEAETIDAGRIVLLGGVAAYTTSADQAVTCLAAAVTAMLNRLLADRLGDHGVCVYELRTGLLATRGDDPARRRYDELIRDGLTPIRRWGQPRDLALAVAAVAEDLLRFSTGQVIDVDGGFHLRRL
jgi:NAD(P)-dependent dehydrogenase (short-subunit alcohol dehydrogenase family)